MVNKIDKRQSKSIFCGLNDPLVMEILTETMRPYFCFNFGRNVKLPNDFARAVHMSLFFKQYEAVQVLTNHMPYAVTCCKKRAFSSK
jgi:hypothetical protein